MRVDQLTLANFRGFTQIDLTFEPDITVIAGVNGVGKSGVLFSLTKLLSRAVRAFTPSHDQPLPFSDDDIREGAPGLDASAIVVSGDLRLVATTQRIRADAERDVRLRNRLNELRLEQASRSSSKRRSELADEQRTIRNLLAHTGDSFNLMTASVETEQARTGELDAVQRQASAELEGLRNRPNQPLTVFFSTQRQLESQPRSLPRTTPFTVESAYTGALGGFEVSVRDFMHWFRLQQERAAGGNIRAKRALESLLEAIAGFVPEFSDLRLEVEPRLRLVVTKDSVPLALHQLSDGEQGLLAMVFDLARRLDIANPEADNPSVDGDGVVLIDEVELHLHPAWQRTVLRRLITTFPRCQFIITTHSPHVIGEAEARCVRFLIRDGARVASWTPRHAFGLDSNRVLEELMEVQARSVSVEAGLKELFRLIDDENFEAARVKIAELESTVGEDEPELTRARTMIAFLEGTEC